jgi:hypothetical protein
MVGQFLQGADQTKQVVVARGRSVCVLERRQENMVIRLQSLPRAMS